MKKIITILPVCLITIQVFSQITSVGMGNEFKQITNFGRRQTGFEGLQTYRSGNVKGSQFFNDNWSTGSVTTTNKEVFSANYLFIYDKVRQELFLKAKDSDMVLLADKNQIYSFSILTDRMHNFQRAILYDPNQKDNFFEVLVQSDKYILLKLIKTTFEKANPNDMEKVKQGNFDDEFVDHITYYLYHNNKIQKINLNENSVRKALKDLQSKVDDFFNLHSNDEFTEQLLINLVIMINS
jgi:hypothetical protein